MCFAPQRRASFPDRNLKNGSDNEVFCTFWLTNVLRATAACHFSGSRLAKWLRPWGVLYILTHKCASRHSGVQFFIPPLSSYLRTRRFYEATFRTAGTTNHWKNTAIRDVANISRTCILSPDCCTTLLLYTAFLHDLTAVVHCFSTRLDCCCTLLFYTTLQLSILSEVSTLNFLRSIKLIGDLYGNIRISIGCQSIANMSHHVEWSVAGRSILRQETKDIRSWRNNNATASRAIGKMESSQLHGFQWIKSKSFVYDFTLGRLNWFEATDSCNINFQPPPAMWFHPRAALNLSTEKAIFSHPTLTTSIKKCFFRAIGLGVRPIGMQRPMAWLGKTKMMLDHFGILLPSKLPAVRFTSASSPKKDLKNIHFQWKLEPPGN